MIIIIKLLNVDLYISSLELLVLQSEISVVNRIEERFQTSPSIRLKLAVLVISCIGSKVHF